MQELFFANDHPEGPPQLMTKPAIESENVDVVLEGREITGISVRLAEAAGQLAEPALFPTGLQPNGFQVTEVNGDGKW